MKRSVEAIEALRAELRQDLEFIELNYQKNREMTLRIDKIDGDDEYQFAALGYTIHNLYNAFESYFLRIAKFFENNLEHDHWHRSLISRMTLEIEEVRPALFDIEFSLKVDELMRFRHLFRNLYKTPLMPEKVLFANGYAEGIFQTFLPIHQRFDSFLKKLKELLQKD
jgi:hypothetical protein